MFSYEILKDEGVIVLTVTGWTNIDDYQDVAPKFFADAESQNIRRILLDWHEFEGWGSKDAPTITFFSWLEARPLVDRIAIVFHDGVRNEVDKFEELFRNADKEIRRFRPEQYEAALEWLKAESGAEELD